MRSNFFLPEATQSIFSFRLWAPADALNRCKLDERHSPRRVLIGADRVGISTNSNSSRLP